MVEGSQVDWAAHGNDPVGIITEYLAFDKAVGKAIEFAKENGETAVVILSDHGNSGITIGKAECKGYDTKHWKSCLEKYQNINSQHQELRKSL